MEEIIFQHRIRPFQYTDRRKPRLPRWQKNKKYDLKKDTRVYFQKQLKDFKGNIPSDSKFSVEITVFKGKDGQGGGDLDNYCKVILDGIKSTKKIWDDDKKVDEIIIIRKDTASQESHIDLKIKLI